jgi:hypothetical protein
MPLQVFGAGEAARALQDEVDAQVVPWQVRRVSFGERRDPSAVDDQRALRGTDIAVIAPVDGVVLQ